MSRLLLNNDKECREACMPTSGAKPSTCSFSVISTSSVMNSGK